MTSNLGNIKWPKSAKGISENLKFGEDRGYIHCK